MGFQGNEMSSLISVIVPLWNHLEDLTIPFIKEIRQTKGDWELILVDNGSKDNTASYIEYQAEEDDRIKPLVLKKNYGFGGGNNKGYEIAQGEEICFISNDVKIGSPNWLLMLSEALKKNPKAMLGPQYVDYNRLTDFDNVPTPYIAGWCMYGSKEMFDKVKSKGQVFDEDFGKAYFEDVWLSVKVVDAGYKLVEVPIDLHHMISQSSDQINIPVTAEENKLIFKNKMMVRELRQSKKKRIVFFCPGVPYGFVDEDYEGKGVGGAEGALIQLTRELASRGWRVEVYNKTNIVGNFGGVHYHNISEFLATDYMDTFVLFRSWHPIVEIVNSKLVLFWSCDQYTDQLGVWDIKVFPYVDSVVAISPYHKDHLENNYKLEKRINVLDLGIGWSDYEKPVKRVPGKAIYCSVPMRGLERLAKLAPVIKAKIPSFNLTITSDYTLWGLHKPGNFDYVAMFANLPYVNFVGKVPREELIEHQKTSQIMVYPCTYDECFCISAMECMAAGAVPVTTDLGALTTTVKDGGVILSNCYSDEKFVDLVVSLLKNRKKLNKYRQRGREIAKKHDWKLITDQWIQLIKKETKMAKRKAKTGKVKVRGVTAPEVALPQFTMLRFTVPVEFAINGRPFATKPVQFKDKVFNQVEVPYEIASAAIGIVRDAYGEAVIIR